MKIRIVNRKYLIGGKWIRFQTMRGVGVIGWKISIGKYEIRFYKKQLKKKIIMKKYSIQNQIIDPQTIEAVKGLNEVFKESTKNLKKLIKSLDAAFIEIELYRKLLDGLKLKVCQCSNRYWNIDISGKITCINCGGIPKI